MSERQQGLLRVAPHERDHAIGSADAPVTLVEYGDYECPHCRRAHPVVNRLRARFGDRLRFIFRNFPLTQIHPHALHAAAAAESVGAQMGADAYWGMHDVIFAHQRDGADALEDFRLATYAQHLGADAARVLMDLESGVFEALIRDDFLGGVHSGVNGTPTFFVNGERFDGDWHDIEAFAAALERAAEAPAAPAAPAAG